MRPVIFFAATVGQATALAEALDCPRLCSLDSPEERNASIQAFGNGQAKQIVVTHGMATGWKAPPNSIIIFLDGFTKNEATRIQAMGRVFRN